MRYKRNSYLIEGLKNSWEALNAEQKLSTIYFSDDAQTGLCNKILELATSQKIQIRKIPQPDLEQVSTLVNPDGMLSIGKLEQNQQALDLASDSQSIFLYRINDPGNLGTILRTAAWFGLDNIILSKGSVDPYNPKVIRASMGGIFYSKIYRNIAFPSLQKIAEANHLQLIAADMAGKNISNIAQLSSNFVLCMGSESHGLPDSIMERADQILSIPKLGQGESLNLAISAGILIKDLTVSK